MIKKAIVTPHLSGINGRLVPAFVAVAGNEVLECVNCYLVHAAYLLYNRDQHVIISQGAGSGSTPVTVFAYQEGVSKYV